jgi:hypothetical protein
VLIAAGCYLLMASEGVAAPPAVAATVAALAYTENDPATVVDAGITVSEPDGDDVLSASVRVTGNYVAGEDVLAFTDQLGISGAWNAGTGLLTLTGTTTAANYEAALRTVTYQNLGDDPSTATRTVTFVVTDVNNETGTDTRSIDVTAVDDPLVVTTTAGNASYTENAAPVVVDAGVSIVDLDDDVTGATVQITGNYVNGEDVLAFTDKLGITGAWDAGTGTLTLSGVAPVADYQTALRTVTYENVSDDPSAAPRSVTFAATTATTDDAVRVVAITSVNDAPGAGGDVTVTDPGGGPASVLEDSVPGAANIRLTPSTFADVDGAVPTHARVLAVTGGVLHQADGSMIGLGPGGSLLAFAGGSLDLRFTPDPDRDTDGSFTYVMVDAADAALNSAPSTATVPIAPVNDPPVATLSAGSVAFTEDAGAVALDGGLTLADVDDAALEGATLQITGNYVNGEDVLSFTDQLGITGVWDGGSGTLTLSGSAALADYQVALRTVTYDNTSDDPSTAARTVTVVVDDGDATSAAATRAVSVTPVNDAPTVTATNGSATYTENDPAVTVDPGVAVADVDDALLTGATVQITAAYASGEDVLAFTAQSGITGAWDAGTATLTLTGTAGLAQYEAALRSVTYLNTSDDPSTAARTVTFRVDDGEVPSAGADRDVTVAAVNDPPVLAVSAGGITVTENDPPAAVDPGLTVTDADDAALAGATVAITTGYWNGEDELEFVDQAGITGSWDASTGTLTLAGAASAAAYETALRSVTYVNTSDAPSPTTRSVTFVADDGTDVSNAAARTVAVVPVNDLPTATLATGAASYVEDASAVALDAALTVSDPDDAVLTGARVAITAGYVAGEDVLAATSAGGVLAAWDAGTGTLILAGSASPATYQTVLRGVTFRNTSQQPATTPRTVSVTLQDPSGWGGVATRPVAVTSVNDAPVAVDDSVQAHQGQSVTVDVVANDTDVESDPLTVTGVGSSPHATATVLGDGRVRIAPVASFAGGFALDYTVSDGALSDTGRITVTVTPTADLRVSATMTPDPVYVGDDLALDIVIANDGPGTASGTGGVVYLAGAESVVRAATAGGACTVVGAKVTCGVPDVAPGASALAQIVVRAADAGPVLALAVVASAAHDPDPGDDAVLVGAQARLRPVPTGPFPVPAPPRPAPAPPITTSTTVVGAPAPTTTVSTTTSTTVASGTSTTVPVRPPADAPAGALEPGASRSRTPLVLGLLVLVAGAVGALVVGMRRFEGR